MEENKQPCFGINTQLSNVLTYPIKVPLVLSSRCSVKLHRVHDLWHPCSCFRFFFILFTENCIFFLRNTYSCILHCSVGRSDNPHRGCYGRCTAFYVARVPPFSLSVRFLSSRLQLEKDHACPCHCLTSPKKIEIVSTTSYIKKHNMYYKNLILRCFNNMIMIRFLYLFFMIMSEGCIASAKECHATTKECRAPTSFDVTNVFQIDTRFQYNWYYGVIDGDAPGQILIRTESLSNCANNISLVYGSIAYYNQTLNSYDHVQSVSLPKSLVPSLPLTWNKWRLDHVNNSMIFQTPAGMIHIDLQQMVSQGLEGNGMVRSGFGNNTAISNSFPFAKYRTFFTNKVVSGYFENVKTSFSDAKHLSWICVYLFHTDWHGFICRSLLDAHNPFAHGMVATTSSSRIKRRWLPSWAFSISDPKCEVHSGAANATFQHCYTVQLQLDLHETVHFEMFPIDGDFGYQSDKNQAWTGSAASSLENLHIVVEIVKSKNATSILQ